MFALTNASPSLVVIFPFIRLALRSEINKTIIEKVFKIRCKEYNLELLKEVLNHLSALEKEIIIARFGLDGDRPRTYSEIAMEYDRTSESIRNWTTKALRKLKNSIKGGYPEIAELV